MNSTSSSDMMTWLPSFATFNGMDWFIVVVVTTSVLISLWRGFTREAMSLAGWVIAFVLANLLASPLSTYLAGIIDNVTGRYIVAWSVLFLVILVASGFAAKGISRLMKASGLGLLDRLLGTVFGFARGVLIIMALVFLLRELVPPSEQQWLHQSQLMPHVDVLMNWSERMFDKVRSGELPTFTV
jgi:membrane protein required for colicin V production